MYNDYNEQEKGCFYLKQKAKKGLAFGLFMTMILCAGCFGGEEKPSEISENSVKESSSVVEESKVSEISEESTARFFNPLTGLEMDEKLLNTKPVAIMINNIEYAQPLLGISKADIAYECLVEGGITRIVAVYKDVASVGTIGSIRSARPPFIELARGLDALYIYCGTSKQADTLLKQNVLDHFDVAYYSDMAWRDSERIAAGYATEHTLVTDGQKLFSLAESYGVDMTTESSYTQKFGTNSQCLQGKAANEITAKFSGYKTTTFKYDTNTRKYTVEQFGEAQYDDTYDCNNAVENVLVLNVNSYLIDDEHVNLDLVGNGSGYYFTQGKYIPIKWSKANADSPLIYTDEKGTELIMAAGRQYVCCVPLNNIPTIS